MEWLWTEARSGCSRPLPPLPICSSKAGFLPEPGAWVSARSWQILEVLLFHSLQNWGYKQTFAEKQGLSGGYWGINCGAHDWGGVPVGLTPPWMQVHFQVHFLQSHLQSSLSQISISLNTVLQIFHKYLLSLLIASSPIQLCILLRNFLMLQVFNSSVPLVPTTYGPLPFFARWKQVFPLLLLNSFHLYYIAELIWPWLKHIASECHCSPLLH